MHVLIPFHDASLKELLICILRYSFIPSRSQAGGRPPIKCAVSLLLPTHTHKKISTPGRHTYMCTLLLAKRKTSFLFLFLQYSWCHHRSGSHSSGSLSHFFVSDWGGVLPSSLPLLEGGALFRTSKKHTQQAEYMQ